MHHCSNSFWNFWIFYKNFLRFDEYPLNRQTISQFLIPIWGGFFILLLSYALNCYPVSISFKRSVSIYFRKATISDIIYALRFFGSMLLMAQRIKLFKVWPSWIAISPIIYKETCRISLSRSIIKNILFTSSFIYLLNLFIYRIFYYFFLLRT